MSRTMTPCTGHPNTAVRAIRPITRRPNIIHAWTGLNGLVHCHRHGRDWRCANHRCRNDYRERQPDGEAEADSGVGRHCGRADQRGQEKHFGFHGFIHGVVALHKLRRTSNRLVTSLANLYFALNQGFATNHRGSISLVIRGFPRRLGRRRQKPPGFHREWRADARWRHPQTPSRSPPRPRWFDRRHG